MPTATGSPDHVSQVRLDRLYTPTWNTWGVLRAHPSNEQADQALGCHLTCILDSSRIRRSQDSVSCDQGVSSLPKVKDYP